MGMIKSLAYGVGSFAAVPRLVQHAFAPEAVAILMYHAVTRTPLAVEDWCFVWERNFREQMLYLKKHCQVIPLRDVPGAIKAKARRPRVALTFDDGFQSNYGVAFPILQELDLPATIFLATGFVDSDDTPWFCRINDALSRTSLTRLYWDGRSLRFVQSSAPRRGTRTLSIAIEKVPTSRAARQNDEPDRCTWGSSRKGHPAWIPVPNACGRRDQGDGGIGTHRVRRAYLLSCDLERVITIRTCAGNCRVSGARRDADWLALQPVRVS